MKPPRDAGALARFIEGLRGLSESELKELEAALLDVERSRVLAHMVRTLIDWKQTRAPRPPKPARPRTRPREQERGRPERPLSNSGPEPDDTPSKVLTSLLEDRQTFPGTVDVVRAVQTWFGFDIDYGRYRKSGRRDLIRACRRRLQDLSGPAQARLLHAFMRKYAPRHTATDVYQRLFRILAGHD